jgi:uncharacterized OsmC-like protein
MFLHSRYSHVATCQLLSIIFWQFIAFIDKFERVITLEGEKLSEADRQALLAIADKCPVHKTLEGKPQSAHVTTRLA